MFSRSHNSKNSGGALTSHLFNRRRLPKATSSCTPDSHSQSVLNTADVPTTPIGSGAARHRQDAYDDPSPVQLVSVRRNTDESTTTTSPAGNVEGSGPRGRRTKLGLSVAVVRGPSTMNNSSSSAASSVSSDIVDDQRELSAVDDIHQSSSDTSVNLASQRAINSTQDVKETGECMKIVSDH